MSLNKQFHPSRPLQVPDFCFPAAGLDDSLARPRAEFAPRGIASTPDDTTRGGGLQETLLGATSVKIVCLLLCLTVAWYLMCVCVCVCVLVVRKGYLIGNPGSVRLVQVSSGKPEVSLSLPVSFLAENP